MVFRVGAGKAGDGPQAFAATVNRVAAMAAVMWSIVVDGR